MPATQFKEFAAKLIGGPVSGSKRSILNQVNAHLDKSAASKGQAAAPAVSELDQAIAKMSKGSVGQMVKVGPFKIARTQTPGIFRAVRPDGSEVTGTKMDMAAHLAQHGQPAPQIPNTPPPNQKRAMMAPPPGEKLAPSPTGEVHTPNPYQINPETGLTVAARVGADPHQVPPPPDIYRLPNLTSKEREIESRFADAYTKDPQGMVDAFHKAQNHVVGFEVKPTNPEAVMAAAHAAGVRAKEKKGKVTLAGEGADLRKFLDQQGVQGGSPIYEIGDAPNIFAMDDVKLLSPEGERRRAQERSGRLQRDGSPDGQRGVQAGFPALS